MPLSLALPLRGSKGNCLPGPVLLPLVLSQVMRIGFRGDRPTDRPWFAIVVPESYNIALSPARAIREAVSCNTRSGEHLLLAHSGPMTCCNVLEVDDLIFQLTRGKHSIYTSGI